MTYRTIIISYAKRGIIKVQEKSDLRYTSQGSSNGASKRLARGLKQNTLSLILENNTYNLYYKRFLSERTLTYFIRLQKCKIVVAIFSKMACKKLTLKRQLQERSQKYKKPVAIIDLLKNDLQKANFTQNAKRGILEVQKKSSYIIDHLKDDLQKANFQKLCFGKSSYNDFQKNNFKQNAERAILEIQRNRI